MNMPRPKSAITKGVYVNIRMSVKQKEMFQDLGGADFLRNYLDRQIRSEEIQLGLPTLKDKYDSSTV
jgi:hypothetical protein